MTATRTTVRHRVHRFLDLVTTPLVPADYLDLINPLRPGADLRGRIVAVRRETADAVTIEIRPGADWRGHVPGQHVRIGVDVAGVRHHRTYSLTSAPGEPTISITPKRISGGLVSSHLVERAQVGDLVHLAQAAGDFHVPVEAPGKVLLVTAGSGITPVLGMLRAGLSDATDVVHVHSDAGPDDMIAGAEIRALAAGGRVRLIERHTATAGRLTAADLCVLVDDWADRETWACGPAGFLDALTDHWDDHGLADRLHTERFTPAPRAIVGDGGLVSFTESALEIDVPAGRTLLEAGEEAGVLMPYGCRMGICHGCLTPLSHGTVRDVRTGALVIAPEGESLPIQTCISEAAGPCHLDR
ncbi:ferredoxin reductase [Granulicoccus sp. GXG6511]|uniref:ferredoxin reductase n=1 Tax=Granulicoccus sp. GXG6511 TaxID=3381351 RepID=UPI003D7DCFFD